MNARKFIFIFAILLCTMPFIDTPIALLLGIVLTWTFKHPFPQTGKIITNRLLKISVVGLGFGMNAAQALVAGKEGFVYTLFSIAITLCAGLLIGKFLKVDKKSSYLISSGTAICGGSAIAAIASVIKPDDTQTGTALGTIFILNSVALLIFPAIGKILGLSQHEFGTWAAIAIHDTSSVVGAASKYGNEALQTATTIKLVRALWIVPLSLFTVFLFKSDSKKIKIPWFIFFFVGATILNSTIPAIRTISPFIVDASKIGLKITLFLIGASLTREMIVSTGVKPLVQGVLLWIFISVVSALSVIYIF